MKLHSYYKDNIYIITQSPHCGAAQDCKAMDFGYQGYTDKNLYAPCDMTFKRRWDDGVEYWVNGCEGAYLQFVHIKNFDTNNKKLGEKFGTPYLDKNHGHLAVFYNNWDIYLNYCDRDAKLYFWTFGQEHDIWTNWNTYLDKNFICYNENEMVTLQLPIKIKTTNTAPLNIREQPNTTAKIVGQIPSSTEFNTKIVASGTEVSGNKTWYGISYTSINGYISGAYVQEIVQASDCSAQEAEIVELTDQNNALKDLNVALEDENSALEAELDSFEPITYYQKKS
jgi:hypothetical protein